MDEQIVLNSYIFEVVMYSPCSVMLSMSVCFLCPFFPCAVAGYLCFSVSHLQMFSSCSLSHVFFYYLPSLSLSSPPSLTSNYPVYVKGKTFPSSLPSQLTSASFRGLCLNVLSCLSLRSALPVLPVLKCK